MKGTFNERSNEPEIIDLGPEHYSVQEYQDCLVKLGRIGTWLGGDSATLAALRRMKNPPDSILDVGCGGGQLTMKLAAQFPKARVLGIDLNPQAIEFARSKLASMRIPPKNVSFETRDQPALEEHHKSYDVVLTANVCHHMSDEELVEFISRACRTAKQKVIINDLQRSFLAFYLFKLISPLFFRNRLIEHDGLISIKKAFTRQELEDYLKKAGLNSSQYSVHWQWAFRWLVEIDCGGAGNG